MSNDLTASLPEGEPRDTNPMLERILEELRALRIESKETREAVTTIAKHLERLDRTIALFERDSLDRYLRLAERVDQIEPGESAKLPHG